MNPTEQRIHQRRLAYVRTFVADPVISLPRGRWSLLWFALRSLFSPGEFYRITFKGDGSRPHPPAAEVMADLRRFAGINRGGIVVSPVSRVVDPYATAYRAGQRDTFLRIAHFIGLDEAGLQEIDDDRRKQSGSD